MKARSTVAGLVLILALTACGALPGAHVSTAGEAGPPCDLDQAKKALFGTSDYEVPKDQEQFICDKAAPAISEEKQREAASSGEHADYPAPTPTPDYYSDEIVAQLEASEVDGNGYQFTNGWSGVIDGQNVVVWAGVLSDEKSHGVLYYRVVDPFTQKHLEDVYIDSPISGPLKITSAEKQQLQVESESTGETATFNAVTREWKNP